MKWSSRMATDRIQVGVIVVEAGEAGNNEKDLARLMPTDSVGTVTLLLHVFCLQ